MIKPRQTSVVILITLAELAWLAAFGLLFAYRGKDGELGKLRTEYTTVSNRLDQWEAASPDVAKLAKELEVARSESKQLGDSLKSFEHLLSGKSAAAVAKYLAEMEERITQLGEWEQTKKELTAQLATVAKNYTNAITQLVAATNTLSALNKRTMEMTAEVVEVRRKKDELQQTHQRMETAHVALTNRVWQLESGEVAIRRELTGLPTNELQRVVFVVDTSSSMHNSPAWKAARDLIRTWIEYLAVQECVLVNFNDQAEVFPKSGYHRVRDQQGSVLPDKKDELLAAFDRAKPGVYSDLLKALKVAYGYSNTDMIVLFTDGQPRVASKTDASFAAEILKEVGWNSGIPILTVAVGSYEVEGAGGPKERANGAIVFLKQLAARTGGSFIGR